MVDPVVIDDGDVVWHFDAEFLLSRWSCLWEAGTCQGVLDHPAPELRQGCCSAGAQIEDADEARLITANAALLDDAVFENHETALRLGVVTDDRSNTRLVDDVCIFFNRPGFAGGAGCALHLAAIDHGESPLDWKPSVCWRLPFAIDWSDDGDTTTAAVRRWTRSDWGSGGRSMAWWCTEVPESRVATTPLVDRMADELTEIAGAEVVVELRGRLLLLVDGHGDAGRADVDAAAADEAAEDQVGP